MVEDSTRGQGTERGGKSDAAFRTISEVAKELDLPQHVLRFWETRFSQVKPLKRGGGRRYYRPEDLQLLQRIRDLLYVDGYTIKGVQKLLRQSGSVRVFVEETASMKQADDTADVLADDDGELTVSSDSGLPAKAPDDYLRSEVMGALSQLRTLRDSLRQSAET